MGSRVFNATDDSGFLALVDPDAYPGFVTEFWNLPDLINQFRRQMQERRLLIWGTDMENTWRVRVQFEITQVAGFREVVGSIVASGEWLLLTNFESLTMAASYEDTVLPQPNQHDQLLRVAPGLYRCRIIQLHDHSYTEENEADLENADEHYVLELLRSEAEVGPWQSVPWAVL